MNSITLLLQQWGPHHGPMGGTGGFGGGLHWSPWWVLLALVVLIGTVYLVGQFRQAQDSTGSTDTRDEAMAVLRRRYASGDIDEAEFEERRTRLSATRHS